MGFAESAGKKATWIGKKVPGIGLIIGKYSWDSSVQAKGPIAGTIHEILDNVPIIQWVKPGIELLTGDWIPDLPDEENEFPEEGFFPGDNGFQPIFAND